MNPIKKPTLVSILGDVELLSEMRDGSGLEAARSNLPGDALDRLVEGRADAIGLGALTQAEAIILLKGRPALLIQDGAWEDPGSRVISQRLGDRAPLEAAIAAVGRVEILDYRSDFVGSGWMIAEDTLITNRHVAELFAERNDKTFAFRTNGEGELYKARVDFKREHDRTATMQASVLEILFLEERSSVRPDFALIRLDQGEIRLPAPIELDTSGVAFDAEQPAELAVIGYPAEDSRNDAFAMRRIFDSIYNVKRLSPGRLMGVRPDGKVLEHDCTSLGGSSGSVVINLATGRACGLHFSGSYRDRNLAVTTTWIKSRLAELETRLIAIPRGLGAIDSAGREGDVEAAPDLADRTGYDPDFLGDGDRRVELPEIPELLEEQVAAVVGRDDGELRYSNFSIKMRADRRLPFFTAVNIDGERLFNFPRGRDRWFLDPRLAEPLHQINADLYTANSLDRGHLVRRLDPAWGDSRAAAKRAELDTFFYTNASPQHAKLNQRAWLGLEDYVLSNSETHALKVSVFAGAVMRVDDTVYRGVQIPEEFWKVVVMVSATSGNLSATGYVLSQTDYLGDLEFTFGAFNTYQVPISLIEEKTGLRFQLDDSDPLSETESRPYREIRGPTDVVL